MPTSYPDNLEAAAIADDPTKQQLMDALRRLEPDPAQPHLITSDMLGIIRDSYASGRINDFHALELGMYATRHYAADHGERVIAVGHMEWLLPQVKPGETALLVSAAATGGYVGGLLDAYPQFVAEQQYGRQRFAMGVAFAGLEAQQQLMLGHVLLHNGEPTADRLLVGQQRITEYGSQYTFSSLAEFTSSIHAGLAVERDINFLRGLYQAGITLTDCGVDEPTRYALTDVFAHNIHARNMVGISSALEVLHTQSFATP